jgi:hypothetical protein
MEYKGSSDIIVRGNHLSTCKLAIETVWNDPAKLLLHSIAYPSRESCAVPSSFPNMSLRKRKTNKKGQGRKI